VGARAEAPRPRVTPRADTGRDAQALARQQDEAARRVDAEAARRPAPVQAPCTPQVAALGLCSTESR
jgi:hypothetical protein